MKEQIHEDETCWCGHPLTWFNNIPESKISRMNVGWYRCLKCYPMPCPECDGTGFQTFGDIPHGTARTTCTKCNGTGQTPPVPVMEANP
jgi:hypothetical protein